MKALAPLRMLEEGFMHNVGGEPILICTPMLAFIADMAQQQLNASALAVSANLGCRSCDVPASKRGDLEYDVNVNARSHYEMTRLRRALNEQPTATARKAFSSEHGIHQEPAAVRHIAPTLDLIQGRPGDTAHSDLGGITKMLHQLLLDAASNNSCD